MVMLAILKTIPCFGLAAFGAVDATPTISWGMNPSSGQAIIWCWLTESNRRHPAYKAGALPAELNQQSGSGLLRIGFNVSCSTSLPKSPDRIAETTKPKGVSLGLLIFSCCSVRFNVPSLSQFKHFPRNYSSKICRHLCQMRHTLVRKASILQDLAKHRSCSHKSASTILDAFHLALSPSPSYSCGRHIDP